MTSLYFTAFFLRSMDTPSPASVTSFMNSPLAIGSSAMLNGGCLSNIDAYINFKKMESGDLKIKLLTPTFMDMDVPLSNILYNYLMKCIFT